MHLHKNRGGGGLPAPPPGCPPRAPEGRRGNSTRGQFRGPSLQVWDFSLRKGFAVGGDVKLQLQADLFNAFNQKSFRFSSQSPNFSGGGFGQLTAIAPPRNVQIGARVTF